jgi:magnesium transporter
MARLTLKKKEEIGLSPFALVFRGQQKASEIGLSIMDFDKEEVREPEIDSADQFTKYIDSQTISWMNIDGLHNVELMIKLAQMFSLEKNVLSDVMNPSVRPKVQELDNGIFVTIKMLQYHETEERLIVENLSLIITHTTLISFQEQKGDVFEPVRDRIRKHKNKIRFSGADYLAFALLDIVVDNYIYIIGQLGDKIENLEENMTNDPKKELLENINLYKRELNFLRKNIKPAKEMILNLAKMESEFIHDENRIHFRELQDNINEATELSDSYREILYDQLNIYHTMMSTKLNDIMRILTVFSVIFIPLTFIAGIYGTNFDYLPELHWHNGYFIMWGIMVMITLGMMLFFKHKKWF